MPEPILLCSQTLRSLWLSQHRFAEHEDRVLRLTHLSSAVVGHIVKYCFAFYLESYAVFQPIDKASPAAASADKVSPATGIVTAEVQFHESAPHEMGLEASLDAVPNNVVRGGRLSPLPPIQGVDSTDDPPFVLPNVVLQFAIPPQDHHAVFMAAHYLHIPPLIRLSASFIAQYLERTYLFHGRSFYFDP